MSHNHGADGWLQPGGPGPANDLTGARHGGEDRIDAGHQPVPIHDVDDRTRLQRRQDAGWQAQADSQAWAPDGAYGYREAGEPHAPYDHLHAPAYPDQVGQSAYAAGGYSQGHFEQAHYDQAHYDQGHYDQGHYGPGHPAAPPQAVGPGMPGAAYPMSQSSAGYPMSQSSGGYPMSQSSAGHPVSQTSAPYPVSQSSAYELQRGPEKTFPLKWLAAGAIMLALVTGIGLFAASEWNRSRVAAPAPAPTMLVQKQAPPGWSANFAWSTTLTQVPSGFAMSDNRIIYVDAKGSLTVLDAETGKVLLQPSQPRFTSQAKVMVADLQGTQTIVVSDAEGLYLWPMNATATTEPKVLTLSAAAKSFPQGGGLLVLVPGRQQWVVTGASQLKPVDLPPDHFALGASPDGFLVAASQTQGKWTYLPSDEGQASREVRPERSPEGTVGDVHIARLSGQVVAAWGDTSDPNRKTVAMYDAKSGRLIASATVDASLVKDLTLTVAPGGKLASAGPLLARLSDGKTEIVERWTPRSSDETHLWASKDGVNHVWTGEGRPTALDPRMLVPWGITKSGTAVVMETVENNQVVLGALKRS